MMRRYLSFIFIHVIFSISLGAAAPMIVVSIDGLRPDAIERANARTLLGLISSGMSFSDAHTVRPSITLPSHTSMLTGLTPDEHGIDWNDYRPDYGPVRHVTAVEIVKNAGFQAIMIVAKDKLLTLNRPNSVNYFEKTDKDAASVAQAFTDYVNKNGLPDVSFLHLPDPDTMGHRYMWMSPAYFAGVRSADAALREIITTAKAATNQMPFILVTADHGGFAFNHFLDIELNSRIPFIVQGKNIPANVVSKSPVHIYDVAATILAHFKQPIPINWIAKPIPIFYGETKELAPAYHLRDWQPVDW